MLQPPVKLSAREGTVLLDFYMRARNAAQMQRIVLYQPDIPQNVGATMRLCACMGAELHIVMPCGFPLDDKKLKRVGMDYVEKVPLIRHTDWDAFLAYRASHAGALLLIETDGATSYTEHAFAAGDYIMLGRESAGTPAYIYKDMDATLHIPMVAGVRSLNVGMAAAMVLSEACRQRSLLDGGFASA